MAYLNNVYGNAAYMGFIQGALQGRKITSSTAGSYTALKTAALAFATQVDANIPFDALVTTAAAITMLVDTASNTIQSNTQLRPGLLQAICSGAVAGSYTEDAVTADYAVIGLACATAFLNHVAGLVSP